MTAGSSLRRSTPEAQGITSSALLEFLDAAEERAPGLHSLMLLRHGHVIAEGWWRPYSPDCPHMLFSLSKSFTSSAIGLAVAESRLSVDDSVLSFFPDDAPTDDARTGVSENLASMQVRHLLSMSTGHADDTTGKLFESTDGNWAKAFLAQPVTYEPGTHFLYNTGATYMLSAIIQRLTGMTLLDYLEPRLLAPLGIVGATWQTCPRGINTGGWGLSATTEAVARFGQLYLQQGEREGQRLLPEAWVAEATTRQVSNAPNPASDWEQGYGYQFWRCQHDAYRGDGAFGQYCIVMPEQDAVLAITSGIPDMQVLLDLVWEHLLPAMVAALPDAALPDDEAANAKLRRRLDDLELASPGGRRSSPRAALLTGQTYYFDANHFDADDEHIESLRFDFADDGCVLTTRDRHGEHSVACGADGWRDGAVIMPDSRRPRQLEGADARLAAARGAWVADDTYVVTLCYYETPFVATTTYRFADDRLLCDYRLNVGFGELEYPQLVGLRTRSI